MEKLKQLFNEALLAFDLPAITLETSAKIFAILYVHGNREEFVLNDNFVADIRYIQERFRVSGGETPDADFVSALNKYIKTLQDYEREHANESTGECVFKASIPLWATKLIEERYNIKL